MDERRAEPRYMCSDLIKVRWEGAGLAEVTANLEDISPSGACIQLEQPVPPGSAITLMLGRHKFKGCVRYCRRHEFGYFAGVRFDSGQKWSRDLYEPQHLLDPADLLQRQRRPKRVN
jgi:hypothetical protein